MPRKTHGLFFVIMNKIFRLLVTVLVITAIGCQLQKVEEEQNSSDGVFNYRLYGNEYEVTAATTSLTGNLIIPDYWCGKKVTGIGADGFSGCASLTNLILPSGLRSIGIEAFDGCSGLTNLILPSGLSYIGSFAFAECRGLTSLVLPSGITSIEGGTFYNCISLTSLTIPSNVTEIGTYAFSYCYNLKNLSTPE